MICMGRLAVICMGRLAVVCMGHTLQLGVERGEAHTNHCQPPIQTTANAAGPERCHPAVNCMAAAAVNCMAMTAVALPTVLAMAAPYNSLPAPHTNHCHPPIQLTASPPYKSSPSQPQIIASGCASVSHAVICTGE